MKYPGLNTVFESLAEKYRELPFGKWESIYNEDENYTEDNFDGHESTLKWQARTYVQDLCNDTKGDFAVVIIIVYPEGVDSLPPAPSASMCIYENGRVEVELPHSSYTHVQKRRSIKDQYKQELYPEGAPAYYHEWGFSPAVESGGFVFISGCTGTMEDGTVPDGIEEQTKQAFAKIAKCLDQAGLGFSAVVEMTTYHVGMGSLLDRFIEAKKSYFTKPYPAWTAIGVTELASEGAIIEIRVIAKC